MANIKTVALITEQYNLIIDTMRDGFIFEERIVRPNNRIATALVIQANLGLRIGDIVNLKFNNIIRDGNRYRLNIIEEKTEKKRTFTVPMEIYNYIKMYCLENNIKPSAKIIPLTERAIQKHLKLVCNYLGFDGISTHSFRKYFATNIYVSNNYNVALVKELLQHSDIATTQKYIGISSREVEQALENNICLR